MATPLTAEFHQSEQELQRNGGGWHSPGNGFKHFHSCDNVPELKKDRSVNWNHLQFNPNVCQGDEFAVTKIDL